MGGWLPMLIGEQFLTPLEGGELAWVALSITLWELFFTV